MIWNFNSGIFHSTNLSNHMNNRNDDWHHDHNRHDHDHDEGDDELFDRKEAMAYIKGRGIDWHPGSLEGDYVRKTLDANCDGYNDDNEPYYTKRTLEIIIRNARQHIKKMTSH